MEKKILICVNRRLTPRQLSCAGRGAEQLAERLEEKLRERGIVIALERVSCLGECDGGPTLRLAPAGPFIRDAREEAMEELLQAAASFVSETDTTP